MTSVHTYSAVVNRKPNGKSSRGDPSYLWCTKHPQWRRDTCKKTHKENLQSTSPGFGKQNITLGSSKYFGGAVIVSV